MILDLSRNKSNVCMFTSKTMTKLETNSITNHLGGFFSQSKLRNLWCILLVAGIGIDTVSDPERYNRTGGLVIKLGEGPGSPSRKNLRQPTTLNGVPPCFLDC